MATEVHAVRPAVWNALIAPEPVTAVKVVMTPDAAELVVVTENATSTEDCSK